MKSIVKKALSMIVSLVLLALSCSNSAVVVGAASQVYVEEAFNETFTSVDGAYTVHCKLPKLLLDGNDASEANNTILSRFQKSIDECRNGNNMHEISYTYSINNNILSLVIKDKFVPSTAYSEYLVYNFNLADNKKLNRDKFLQQNHYDWDKIVECIKGIYKQRLPKWNKSGTTDQKYYNDSISESYINQTELYLSGGKPYAVCFWRSLAGVSTVGRYDVFEITGDITKEQEDAFPFKQYLAKAYINSNLLPDRRMLYTEIEENYSPTEYFLVNVLSFGWEAKFGFTDSSQLWEAVLLDILLKTGSDESTYNSYLSDSIELEKSILVFLDDAGIGLNDPLSFDTLKNIKNVIHDMDIPFLGDEASFMKKFGIAIDGAKTVKDFIKDFSNYLSLKEHTGEYLKSFLSRMKGTYNYDNIPAFRQAVDRIITNISVDDEELFRKVLSETVTEKVILKTINETIGTAIDVLLGSGVSDLIDVTKETTIYLMDTICGTGSIAQANINLYILNKIDEAASEAYTRCSGECVASDYTQSYREIIGGYQFFDALYRYGVHECRVWTDEISKDMLTRLEDNELLIRKTPGCDKATEYFNLERNSTDQEKTAYVADRSDEDEQYTDRLDSLPADVIENWYYENEGEEEKEKFLVVFNILNYNSSTEKKSTILQKGERIVFPGLPHKNGYKTPTQWYTDAGCTSAYSNTSGIEHNMQFYTKYQPTVTHILIDGGKGLTINQVRPNSLTLLDQAPAPTGLSGEYSIPAFIDGYKVVELGKDIFSGCDNVTSVSVPSTVKKIDAAAFSSIHKNTAFSVVEGSAAQQFLSANGYKNIIPRSEVSFGTNTIRIRANSSRRLKVKTSGSNEFESLNWSSSDNKIAKIADGILTANKVGTVTVTAYTETAASTCQISVINKVLTGDADYDGDITVMDATLIQYYLAEIADEYDLDLLCSDVNADNQVEVVDATYIQRYAAGMIDRFN